MNLLFTDSKSSFSLSQLFIFVYLCLTKANTSKNSFDGTSAFLEPFFTLLYWQSSLLLPKIMFALVRQRRSQYIKYKSPNLRRKPKKTVYFIWKTQYNRNRWKIPIENESFHKTKLCPHRFPGGRQERHDRQ